MLPWLIPLGIGLSEDEIPAKYRNKMIEEQENDITDEIKEKIFSINLKECCERISLDEIPEYKLNKIE